MRWLAIFRGGPLDGQQREVNDPVLICMWYWSRDAVHDTESFAACSDYVRDSADHDLRVVEYVAS